MRLPERTIDFGWPDDRGIGEMLVRQVLERKKWATCGFKRAYTPAELDAVLTGKGRLHKVCSVQDPTPRAVVRVTDVFETPFGTPDPRLVEGEGDGADVDKFKRDHRIAWEADFGDLPLDEEEPLVVEIFELVRLLDEGEIAEPNG